VTITDAHAEFAMLALQGPDAREILRRHLTDGEEPERMRWTLATVAGVPEVGVCGTGYTGEDGVELLIPPDHATTVWDALTNAGATPAGLGARDTLRLEVCFHLYGNDLSEDRNPIEAGLGWACKLDTNFIGADTLKDFEPTQKIVPFALAEKGVPRQGNGVVIDGQTVGEVTSGTMSPCLEQGIGMAYVPVAATEPGTPIEIDIRGRIRSAEVRKRPLYSKES
jgi:aminomethyltransferase